MPFSDIMQLSTNQQNNKREDAMKPAAAYSTLDTVIDDIHADMFMRSLVKHYFGVAIRESGYIAPLNHVAVIPHSSKTVVIPEKEKKAQRFSVLVKPLTKAVFSNGEEEFVVYFYFYEPELIFYLNVP